MKDRDEVGLELHPDPNELDRCWVGQTRIRLAYGFERADARRELAQAKADLEVTESELKRAVREDPGRFGIAKVTEDAIKSAVPVTDEYQAARQKVIDCQHEVDVLDAALEAIDDRRHALEDLVRLFLADYYGKPKAPEGAREGLEEAEMWATRRRGRREAASE